MLQGSVGYVCLLLAGHSERAWSNQISSAGRLLQVGSCPPTEEGQPVRVVRRPGIWSGGGQVELARHIIQVCSSFVLTAGTQGTKCSTQAKPWPGRISKYFVQIQTRFFFTVIIY